MHFGKNFVFNFLGADFLAPKSTQLCQNQPVLPPVSFNIAQINLARFPCHHLFTEN